MTSSAKLAAIGACALIAGAGGAGVAAVVVDGHNSSSAAAAAPASSNPTRPVSDDSGMTAKQVYNEAKDSVAYIQAETGQGTATGSGFVVSSDGKIVTNEHVVDGAQSVSVKLGVNGKAQSAKVLAADASKDLALIQIDATNLKPLSFGDSSAVQVGDNVFAIGNPYGLDHTLTSGIISALGRDIQAPDGTPIKGALQTDAALNPGNSGGALIDSQGKVVGVNSQIASSGSSSGGEPGNVGIGFAIPSNTVKAFVDHPTSSGSTAQGEQGLGGQQVDPSQQGQQQQVDPSQQQIDPSQIDPSQIDPSQIDPSQIDPSQVDPSQVDPWGDQGQGQGQGQEVDPSQVDPWGGQDDQGQGQQQQDAGPQVVIPVP
ncbi:MAG TPA: trypsin-like peptidase domain-containing protein [Baekduia sp.]